MLCLMQTGELENLKQPGYELELIFIKEHPVTTTLIELSIERIEPCRVDEMS